MPQMEGTPISLVEETKQKKLKQKTLLNTNNVREGIF